MIGPKEALRDLKEVLNIETKDDLKARVKEYKDGQKEGWRRFAKGQWREFAALWATIYALKYVYLGLHHFFTVRSILGAMAVVWLVGGFFFAYRAFFGRANYRGAIGCEQKRLNDSSFGSYAAVIGFFPIIAAMWFWDKVRKKLGL